MSKHDGVGRGAHATAEHYDKNSNSNKSYICSRNTNIRSQEQSSGSDAPATIHSINRSSMP